jgi:hypothetical protein
VYEQRQILVAAVVVAMAVEGAVVGVVAVGGDISAASA